MSHVSTGRGKHGAGVASAPLHAHPRGRPAPAIIAVARLMVVLDAAPSPDLPCGPSRWSAAA